MNNFKREKFLRVNDQQKRHLKVHILKKNVPSACPSEPIIYLIIFPLRRPHYVTALGTKMA